MPRVSGAEEQRHALCFRFSVLGSIIYEMPRRRWLALILEDSARSIFLGNGWHVAAQIQSALITSSYHVVYREEAQAKETR